MKFFFDKITVGILPFCALIANFYSTNIHLIKFDNSLLLLLSALVALNYIWYICWSPRHKLLAMLPTLGVISILIQINFINSINGFDYLVYTFLTFFCLTIFLYFTRLFFVFKFFILSVLLTSVIDYSYNSFSSMMVNKKVENDYQSFSQNYTLKSTPNIYHLVVDTYPSQESTDVDKIKNKNILKFLKSKEFYINNNAYSAYDGTYRSMSSIFNMDFNDDWYKESFMQARQYGLQTVYQGRGAAFKILLNNGYTVFNNNFGVYNNKDFDQKSNQEGNTSLYGDNDLTWFLRSLSLYDTVANFLQNREGRRYPLYDMVGNISLNNSPFYVYVHSYNLHGGVNHCGNGLPREENLSTFKEQISCVNKDIQRTIQYIEKTDPNSIVLLHADHGSVYPFRYSNETRNEKMKKRFGILYAVKWPEKCSRLNEQNPSIVNIFTKVFSCLSDEKIEEKSMRPHNSYIIKETPYERLMVIEDGEVISPKPVPVR